MIEFNEKELKADLKDYIGYLGKHGRTIYNDFFTNHADMISLNDFKTLYEEWRNQMGPVSVLTEILLLSSIDPLENLTEIPSGFIQDIPLKKVVIPNSIKKIYDDAFRTTMHRRLPAIYYEGTLEDWDKIAKKAGWDAHVSMIITTDGKLYY